MLQWVLATFLAHPRHGCPIDILYSQHQKILYLLAGSEMRRSATHPGIESNRVLSGGRGR